jgi:hypothetical protein
MRAAISYAVGLFLTVAWCFQALRNFGQLNTLKIASPAFN